MKTLLSAVVLALLLLTAPAIFACSCGGYPTVCGSYRSADAVFIGVVQRVITHKAKGEDGREYPVGQIAHIQVEKSFKGMAQSEVVFRTEGSSCDPFYQEGQRWCSTLTKTKKLTHDVQDIKLTFPFPHCKRAKEEQ